MSAKNDPLDGLDNTEYNTDTMAQDAQDTEIESNPNSTNSTPTSTFASTSIDQLVILLSDEYRKIIPISEIKLHDSLWWGGNGVGNRWARQRFNYSVVYAKSNSKQYSENDEDRIPQDVLDVFMSENKITAGIIGIYVHSKRTNIKKRPINEAIHKQITSGATCVVCGTSSEIVCDHKNDLYNDDRVLDVARQTLDDFQPLCNHCNLQKRQICKDEEACGIFYSAKQIARYRQYAFEFPWEKKAYDRSLPSCKADTFWYDPVEFDRKIYYYATQTIPLVRELKNLFAAPNAAPNASPNGFPNGVLGNFTIP
jgi:5-methylcytosine-specific restriction endonuclease McrA